MLPIGDHPIERAGTLRRAGQCGHGYAVQGIQQMVPQASSRGWPTACARPDEGKHAGRTLSRPSRERKRINPNLPAQTMRITDLLVNPKSFQRGLLSPYPSLSAMVDNLMSETGVAIFTHTTAEGHPVAFSVQRFIDFKLFADVCPGGHGSVFYLGRARTSMHRMLEAVYTLRKAATNDPDDHLERLVTGVFRLSAAQDVSAYYEALKSTRLTLDAIGDSVASVREDPNFADAVEHAEQQLELLHSLVRAHTRGVVDDPD
jgi:hypothetical protein